jgi:hypothetical protein
MDARKLKVGDRVLVGEKVGQTHHLAFPRGYTFSPRLRFTQAATVTGIDKPRGRDRQTMVYVKLDNNGQGGAFLADWIKPI